MAFSNRFPHILCEMAICQIISVYFFYCLFDREHIVFVDLNEIVWCEWTSNGKNNKETSGGSVHWMLQIHTAHSNSRNNKIVGRCYETMVLNGSKRLVQVQIDYTTTGNIAKQATLTYRTDDNYSHWKHKCQFFVLSIGRRLNTTRHKQINEEDWIAQCLSHLYT